MQPGRDGRAVLRSAGDVARLVDHTLLRPDATAEDVRALVAEAVELGVYAVCVSPTLTGVAAAALPAGGPLLAAVAGFPSGKHAAAVKAHEAALAVAAGAAEIDMVIDAGAALAGDYAAVGAEVAAVRAAAGPAVLKVIIESALLLAHAGPDTVAAMCRVAAAAGADYVKTSTGFHPAGGASVTAVQIMAATVGGVLGVKASGGIRRAEDAVAMLDAGATRLGLSGTRDVLAGLPG